MSNHNDVVFDYHDHDDHILDITHHHDNHPRHHHDRNGSVDYCDDRVTAGDDGLNVYPLNHKLTNNHVIGVGGNDIDSRTSRTATANDATTPAGDRR